MTGRNTMQRFPAWRFIRRLALLRRDKRGVGAVEFALIAPLLLSLYITSFELTVALSISKRVTRTASTIADLITQQSSVTDTYLETMNDVASAVFMPYSTDGLSISVTGVTIDAAGSPTVAWSWNEDGGRPYDTGTAVDVPTDMRSPSTFLVRAEVSIPHQILMFMPALMPNELRTITLKREFFYRQRVGSSISCSGC